MRRLSVVSLLVVCGAADVPWLDTSAEAPERTHRILRMGAQVGPREETLDEALTRLGREAAFQHSLGGHPLGGVFAGFGFGPG